MITYGPSYKQFTLELKDLVAGMLKNLKITIWVQITFICQLI